MILYRGECREVVQMRPGLTSLAQIVYRDEGRLLPAQGTERCYVTQILPRKLALDFYCVRHWSFLLDLKIFALGLLPLLNVRPPARLWPVGEGFPARVSDA